METDLWQRYERYCRDEGLTKLRIKKLKVMFVTVNRGIKNLETAKKDDIREYINKVMDDIYIKKDGSPFSATTKSDIKKFIKQFYKWLRGNGETYPEEVNWIKSKIAKDELPPEKDVLNPEQIIKLAYDFKTPQLRIAILILFDSGFRIGELMTCKKQDLTYESFGESGEKCFWLRCNDSKTYDRKIPLQLFSEDIKNWLNTIEIKEKAQGEPLFDFNPESLRLHMKKKAMKLFKMKISIHNLRHSSATYYAKLYEGNSMMLAQRYGWTFNSKQLATYIRRSGAYNNIGAKTVYKSKLSDLEEENRKLKEQMANIIQRLDKLSQKETLKEMTHKGQFNHLKP